MLILFKALRLVLRLRDERYCNDPPLNRRLPIVLG